MPQPFFVRTFILWTAIPVCCAMGVEFELSPNPSPGSNTITIATGDVGTNNAELFENFGQIVVEDGATLRNVTEMDILFDEDGGTGGLSTVNVHAGGLLDVLADSKMNFDSVSHFTVSGTVNNSGDISSDWSMQLAVGSQFNNSGIVNNKQGATFRGSFINTGAFLNSSGITETGGFFQQIGDFVNEAGATMVNQGELLNFTTTTNHGAITNEVFQAAGIGRGIFRNMGTLNNEVDGLVTNRHRWFNTGTLNNAGEFVNHIGGLGMSNAQGAHIENLPTGTFRNERSINGVGTITNAGVFFAGDVSGSIAYRQTGGESIVDGDLGAVIIEFEGGLVRGNGIMSGAVSVLAGAMIAPGDSAGQLTIDGSFGFDGIYLAEIGANSVSDVIDVSGPTVIGSTGVLDVSFLGAYEPQPGDAFDIFFAEQINQTVPSVMLPAGNKVPYSLELLVDEFGTRDVLRLNFSDDLLCDFDGDGTCGLTDLNGLLSVGPITGGVSAAGNEQFDLNADGVIDLVDRDNWLSLAANHEGLGSPYKLGDANLDGTVDGQDFLLWNANKFSSSLEWDAGDFDGDGVVDGVDFLAWNANKFRSSDLATVPEPCVSLQWLVLLLAHQFLSRRKLG